MAGRRRKEEASIREAIEGRDKEKGRRRREEEVGAGIDKTKRDTQEVEEVSRKQE